MELIELGRMLWCVDCKEALSLQYTEKVVRRGLSSELTIRCHKCFVLNVVCTNNSVAHNLAFGGPRVFRAINRLALVDEFSDVIYGFIL